MSTWTSNYSYRKVCKIIYKVATYHIQHALSKRETLIHTVACFRLCFMSLSFTRRSLISDTAKHNHELPTWTELLQLLLTMIFVRGLLEDMPVRKRVLWLRPSWSSKDCMMTGGYWRYFTKDTPNYAICVQVYCFWRFRLDSRRYFHQFKLWYFHQFGKLSVLSRTKRKSRTSGLFCE